jgi:hypothetical protein
MRVGLWTMTAVITLALAGPAWAQFLPGRASSTKIVNQPIPTNITAPTQLGSFNLTGLFHRVNVLGGNPTVGYSPLPMPRTFPSTKYPNFKSTPFEPANPVNIFNPLKVIKNKP